MIISHLRLLHAGENGCGKGSHHSHMLLTCTLFARFSRHARCPLSLRRRCCLRTSLVQWFLHGATTTRARQSCPTSRPSREEQALLSGRITPTNHHPWGRRLQQVMDQLPQPPKMLASTWPMLPLRRPDKHLPVLTPAKGNRGQGHFLVGYSRLCIKRGKATRCIQIK